MLDWVGSRPYPWSRSVLNGDLMLYFAYTLTVLFGPCFLIPHAIVFVLSNGSFALEYLESFHRRKGGHATMKQNRASFSNPLLLNIRPPQSLIRQIVNPIPRPLPLQQHHRPLVLSATRLHSIRHKLSNSIRMRECVQHELRVLLFPLHRASALKWRVVSLSFPADLHESHRSRK